MNIWNSVASISFRADVLEPIFFSLRFRRNRVLVAEPDDILRKICCELLVEEGYRVFSASSGPEALESIRTNPLDLMICELILPQITGLQVVEFLQEKQPRCKILLVSSTFMLRAHASRYPALAKPFRPSELVCEIERVLDC